MGGPSIGMNRNHLPILVDNILGYARNFSWDQFILTKPFHFTILPIYAGMSVKDRINTWLALKNIQGPLVIVRD